MKVMSLFRSSMSMSNSSKREDIKEGRKSMRRNSNFLSVDGTGTTCTSTGRNMRMLSRSESFKLNTRKSSAKEERKSMRRASAYVCEENTVTSSASIDSSRKCSGNLTMKKHAVPKNSINEGIVEKFIEYFNNHDVDRCIALIYSKCEWRFNGEVRITIKEFGDMIQKIMDSFPDFSFDGDEAVEVGPGVVQMRHVVASGTHTGEPFGFQNYNPLPSKGVRCVNDLEHLTFFIHNGRIAQVHVVCCGQLCGPVGLYKQIKEGQVSQEPTRGAASTRQSRRRASARSRTLPDSQYKDGY